MNRKAPDPQDFIIITFTLKSLYREVIIFIFLIYSLGPIPLVEAQEINFPVPGVMLHLSPPLDPPVLKGVTVHQHVEQHHDR